MMKSVPAPVVPFTLCFLWVLGLVFNAWAQSDRGTVTGTLTDASGAVLVGVSLAAVDVATGLKSKTISGESGAYTIPLLPVGTYRVTSEMDGFKTHVSDNVAVQVNQTTRLDIVMEVGEVSQTVEVVAEGPQLRSDTSELGTVISQQEYQDLPLIGQREVRNPTFFMILVPGVTGRGIATVDMSQFNMRNLSTTVSGSQSGSTEWHLDGSIIASAGEFSTDPRNVGFPPDAVGGFKMITLNAPAEYGRSGGGIASFTLKSGSNQLHGSLYEYFRNDALDARGFFVPTTPVNRQNEFGATVSGPIHKDKTFFFGWYNGFRMHEAKGNSLLTVPTTAMKQGDFSSYLGFPTGRSDALGRPVYQGAIYDPLTTRTVEAGEVDLRTGLTNASGSSATLRDAFGFDPVSGIPIPGQANHIPSNRFDGVAKNILPLFPEPNRPGISNFLSQAVNINRVNG
jgi:carboxypeptidase family protein